MPSLILNDNYLLQVDRNRFCKNIRKITNKNYKFIKRDGTKLIFTNGKNKFTLWRFNGHYTCYITLEKKQ